MIRNKNALVVFAKPPIPGYSKTRLIPKLGSKGAAEFHQKLVEHTLENIISPNDWDCLLYAASDIENIFFENCARKNSLLLKLQVEGDLGNRMYHAFFNELKQYEKVIIVGTDCPVLESKHIRKAFEELSHSDVVMTPAEDGGYVLIGAKERVEKKYFSNIRWGTNTVFEKNKKNIAECNCTLSVQPMLWDVDVPVDYEKVIKLGII